MEAASTSSAWQPPAYSPGGWARTFAGLGFGLEFPAPGSGDAEWGEFVSSSWRLSLGLVALGGVAAAAVPAVLRFHPPKVKGPQGGPPWPQFIGACCATLIGLGAVAGLSAQLSGRGFPAAADELSGALQALTEAGSLADTLSAFGRTVSEDLDLLYERCPASIRVSLGSSVDAVKAQVGKYVEEVGHLAKTLAALAAWVGDLQVRGRGVGGSLPACLVLSVVAAIGCCVGVAVPVAVAFDFVGEKYTRRLGMCKLPCLSMVLVAPVVLLISVVAASELSLGIQLGAFCGAADVAAAGYATGLLGNASSQGPQQGIGANSVFNASARSLELARYAIEGGGVDPASASLNTAESEIDASVEWVKEYAAPLIRICPMHSFASIIKDLRELKTNLHKEKALLEPARLHAFYSSAVHDQICGAGASGLGWLIFWQVLLGLACLPALTLTTSSLLDGLTDGREFKPVSRDEQVVEEAAGDEEEKGFNLLYHATFVLSAFMFAVGALMYFIPSTSIIRRITGTLLFACGTFLLTNSDLIVTYVRMKVQIGRFEENNAHFAKSLDEQAVHIRALQKAAQGLKEVDQKFGGSVQQAMKEVGRLKATSRANVAMCARQLCRMYNDLEKDGVISSGVELDRSFELMGTVFGGIVEQYADREMRLRASLTFHPKYQQAQGVKVDTFAKLMEAALKEESADGVPDAVKRIMDKAKLRTRGDFPGVEPEVR